MIGFVRFAKFVVLVSFVRFVKFVRFLKLISFVMFVCKRFVKRRMLYLRAKGLQKVCSSFAKGL